MIGLVVVVIDASVAVSIVRQEPEAEVAAAAIADGRADEGRIVVPAHFWLEVANALLVRRRMAGRRRPRGDP